MAKSAKVEEKSEKKTSAKVEKTTSLKSTGNKKPAGKKVSNSTLEKKSSPQARSELKKVPSKTSSSAKKTLQEKPNTESSTKKKTVSKTAKTAKTSKTAASQKVSEKSKTSDTKKTSSKSKTTAKKTENKKTPESKSISTLTNTEKASLPLTAAAFKSEDVSMQIEQSNREITELLAANEDSISYYQEESTKKSKAKKTKMVLIAAAVVVVFAIIAVILFARGCSAQESDKYERENTIQLAKKYMEKGQLDPAMELINGLLIKNGDDQELNELLDKLIELKTIQDKENAPNFTVINQNPGNGSYDINIDTDSITNALDSMTKKLNDANEANARSQEQINRLLEAQRQDEQERKAQTKALEEQKKKEDQQRKVEEAELAKKNKQVQDEIKKINDLIELGNASLNTGKSFDALNKYQEACKYLPISQGEPRFSGSKYADIASNLYDAAEKEKNPDTKLILMENAVQYANKAIEKDPSNAKAHFIIAMNAENNKDGITSEKELELAVKNDSNNYLYYYYLGRRQQINKKYSQARSSYNSSIKLNPNFDSSYFNLGLTCNKLNLQKEALSSFRKAYSVNPQHAKAYLEEARLLRKGFNDLDGSINSYNKVLAIEPDNLFALKECGSVYAEVENYSKAENCFRRVIAKLGSEKDPMTYFNLSTVLYNQAKFLDALKYSQEAYDSKDILRMANAKAMIVYQYALCSEKNGDADKAIALYREVLTLNPSHAKAKINLGIMYMEMNPPNVDTALKFLSDAFQEDSGNFEVNNNLGNAYLLKKDYKSAINYYLNASKLKPKDVDVKINLAKAYTESGEFDNAKVTYMEVLNLNSNSYDSYIELAKVCIALKDEISAEGYLIALQNKKPEYRTAEVKTLLDTVRPKQ